MVCHASFSINPNGVSASYGHTGAPKTAVKSECSGNPASPATLFVKKDSPVTRTIAFAKTTADKRVRSASCGPHASPNLCLELWVMHHCEFSRHRCCFQSCHPVMNLNLLGCTCDYAMQDRMTNSICFHLYMSFFCYFAAWDTHLLCRQLCPNPREAVSNQYYICKVVGHNDV